MVILLVEDNPGDIMLMAEQFHDLDPEYDMMIITNGSNAINHVKNIENNPQNDKPDLIILDDMLPKASGLDILSVIRNTERLKNTCVVMMSGSNDPNSKEIALENGANDYFQKPEDFSELRTIVERMLALVNSKH